jgi:peptidoglycan hydrolase CwlO-like protein
MNAIPMQYKILLAVIALLTAFSGGFKFGDTVGSARTEVVCSSAKQGLNEKIESLNTSVLSLANYSSELKLKIVEYNGAIDAEKARADAAEGAKAQAEKLLAQLKSQSDSRIGKLNSDTKSEVTCGPVLKRYWDLRQ